MLKKYKNILTLIKIALTDSSANIDELLDYDELFELSRKHQIIPLVFHGLYKIVRDFESKEKYYNYTFRLMCHDQNQLYWLNKIKDVFAKNSIDFMLLKGSSIKDLYPSSEMRLMGDIDILIREEQYPVIREILSQTGLKEGKETDHELIWTSGNGVLIELHKKLIPSYNDDYYSYYYNSWNKAFLRKDHHYSMSVEDEYIYMFTHLTKHYRDGGIGLRHIIDIWYFTLCHPEINMIYVKSELEKLDLAIFHNNVLETINVWFNDKESTKLTDYITERIIESGSYGIKEKRDAANATRLAVKSTSIASAKRKNIVTLIFMPYSKMKQKYPFLHRVPFLLPVMWAVRWFDALINKKSNVTRQIERINKIERNTVDTYIKELEMVGLKFDLKRSER